MPTVLLQDQQHDHPLEEGEDGALPHLHDSDDSLSSDEESDSSDPEGLMLHGECLLMD